MVTSTIKYLGNLRTECTHTKSKTKVISDAPVDNNGKGEAFSPTDFVATSLASCIITIMAIKAKKKNIQFSKVHAEVVKHMASNPRRIGKIEIELKIGDVWTREEKEYMEGIAQTCPVALSLHPDTSQEVTFIYE